MKFFIFVMFMMFSSVVFAVPTTLTVQELSETAYTQSLAAGDEVNGNQVLNNNGDVFFLLSNPGASTASVVFDAASGTVEVSGYGPLVKSDLTVELLTGATKLVGPFAKRAWNDSAGFIQLTFTGAGAADVVLKPYRLRPSLLN